MSGQGRLGLGAFVLGCALLIGAVAGWPAAQAAPPRPADAAPGDWPMYGHDAQHTSTTLVETTITTATLTSLVPRWEVYLGTNGTPSSSAPVIADGRVYVGSSVATGPNFFAFDAVTGAPLWNANLGYIADCNLVGIGSTAAVSGGVLVVGGGDGAYYGFDAATGTPLWREPLGDGPSGFAWESPLIVSPRVYLGASSYCDNPSVRGEVRVVDLATGAHLGSQYFVPEGQIGGGIWNSPALSPDGTTLAVTTGEDRGEDQPMTRAMAALDPITLAIRAYDQHGDADFDADFATSPTFFHNSQNQLRVAAVHKDGYFYAYDPAQVSNGPVWSDHVGFWTGMVPAYDPTSGPGGTLFEEDASGKIFAVNPDTGGFRWYGEAGHPAFGNLAIANGMVFVNRGSAGLQVLDEATGAELTTLPVDHPGQTYTGPVIANGFVYWVAGAYLNAWSLPGPATPTPVPVPPTPTIGPGCLFSDVCPDDYFYPAVNFLVARQVLSGYGDNTFRPYATTTRAQLAKMAVLAFSLEPYTPPTPTFSDVPAEHPFFAYIEAAAHAGVISGYADGTFQPYADVTRGQIAKIAMLAAGRPLITPAVARFADVPPGSPFFSYVETAACAGLLSGYDCGGPGEPCDAQNRPYFRPGNSATRGQVAKIVYNTLEAPAGCLAPTATPAKPGRP